MASIHFGWSGRQARFWRRSLWGIMRRTEVRVPQPAGVNRKFIQVDPAELYLPPSRRQGVDPAKLARQIVRHGASLDGMPPLEVTRGKDGKLRINDGVTRATRAAKLRPGELITAEIIQELPKLDVTKIPQIKDTLP